MSPLDENDIPYEVRIRLFYKEQHRTESGSLIAPSTCRRLTFPDLPSDVPVKFSLAAINKQSKAGPSAHKMIRPMKPC